MKKYLARALAVITLSLLCASCVKDTDFQQAREVTITPVVELDLIFFDLDAGRFFDTSTNQAILVVTDETEIRFLDDSGTQESLIRTDFLFEFENSIQRPFDVVFDFLAMDDSITYTTQTSVAPGSPGAPVQTIFEHTVAAPDIALLTMANRVRITIRIPSATPDLQGSLNLRSKTTYYLEIKERQ